MSCNIMVCCAALADVSTLYNTLCISCQSQKMIVVCQEVSPPQGPPKVGHKDTEPARKCTTSLSCDVFIQRHLNIISAFSLPDGDYNQLPPNKSGRILSPNVTLMEGSSVMIIFWSAAGCWDECVF